MSRTTRVETAENPAKKMLKYKSSEGTFQYWDKDLEKNISVELPFKFAVLDEKHVSFSGYDEDSNSNIWSNEVKDPNDMVIVKAGSTEIGRFLKKDWKSVKDKPEFASVNYTQILYVAADLGNGMEMCRIMLLKSTLTGGILKDKKTGVELPGQEEDGWFRFMSKLVKEQKSSGIYDNFITIPEIKAKKNGAVTYTIPVYDYEPMSAEENANFDGMAVEVDKFFQVKSTTPVAKAETVTSTENIEDELPF